MAVIMPNYSDYNNNMDGCTQFYVQDNNKIMITTLSNFVHTQNACVQVE